MKLFLTGGTGFIGSFLLATLIKQTPYQIAMAFHRSSINLPNSVSSAFIGELDSTTDWLSSLQSIDVVIHLAGRAHRMNGQAKDPLSEFRRVNVDGTLSLAHQAAEVGVKRFLFISSLHVNGTQTYRPFTETDPPNPLGPYAISKFEPEQGLFNIAAETGMEVVIIRPPLVYGPNAPGNFGNLVNWVHRGIPLPLGSVRNKRSLIALDNLVNFIIHCIGHPKAANEIFLISDNRDVSTSELLKRVGQAFGKKTFLVPIPEAFLKFGVVVIGKKSFSERLLGSLQVDCSKAMNLLGWKPVVTMDEQLKKIAETYRS